VQGPVKRSQGDLGGVRALYLAERAYSFQAYLRMLVANSFGKQFQWMGQPRMPVTQNSCRCSASMVISGVEQRVQQPGLNQIKRLIGPESFKQMVFVIRVARVELRNPGFERLGGRLVMRAQHPLGEMAGPILGSLKGIQKSMDGCSRQLRPAHEGAAPGGHAPDAAMRVVASGIAGVRCRVL